MTRDETKQILMVLQAAYPNFAIQDKSMTIEIWQMAFADADYNAVQRAVMDYIQTDTKGFAPSIGQINDKLYNHAHSDELNELEAWAIVDKAIDSSAYAERAEKNFNSFPPIIQKAVGSVSVLQSWGLDDEAHKSVLQSTFLRNYRQVVERQKEVDKLSPSLRQEIKDSLFDSSTKFELTYGNDDNS